MSPSRADEAGARNQRGYYHPLLMQTPTTRPAHFHVQKHRSAVAGKADPVCSNFLSATMAMAGLEPDDDDKKLEDCTPGGSDFDTE